ncbi:MAG: beta-galactosidase, partial [bacterium]
ITTNYAYFKFLPVVDPYRNRDDLDFASHTMYLLSTALEYSEGDEAFRLGSGLELAFSADFARGVNGRTGIMELQPGQINWGSYNAQPLPGAVRMWVWHSYGLGDEFICTYRFRQPLFGGEMYHKGIMETDGITVSPGGNEYARTIEEFRNVAAMADKDTELPEERKKCRTAFLWNFDNIFDQTNIPHNQDWDVWKHNYNYYAVLKSMGVEIDFITEEEEFDPEVYPYMVAPAYQLLDEKLIERWMNYVESGGNLVLSCRTAQKDRNGHLWETLLQEPVYELIGSSINFNDQLPSGQTSIINYKNNNFKWNTWAEILEPEKNTKILAFYDQHFYKGKAAAVNKIHEKGSVTYIGANSADRMLEREVLRDLYIEKGGEIMDLPWYVFVEWRDGLFVAVNYSSDEYNLNIDEENIVIGKKVLKPGGVTVWK